MFIDIHSHINNEKFENEIEDVISRAKEANVGKIVCVGCDVSSCKTALELAEKFENVYASIGIHPNNVLEYNQEVETLLRSAKENKKVVAIGEIGLDYYDLDWQLEQIGIEFPNIEISKEDFVAKQKEIFIKQLELAKEIGLPIMIHMRDATSDTLKILEENSSFVENGGLLHCYSGSFETTMRVFNLGLFVSIGGAITFKNSRIMPEVLEEVGIDRVTLETDCPYLCPEPFRGKRNEPKNIPLIANRIASITGLPIEEVERKTTENAFKVFPRLK